MLREKMINKQKNNILNTTEQEKKEIEKLFLDAETINPKDLLIKVQDIHKKLILKKDYSLISFILSLSAVLQYKLSSGNFKIASQLLNDAKFLAVNEKNLQAVAVNDYCRGVIRYYEGELGEANYYFNKIKTDDLPFECIKQNIKRIIKNLVQEDSRFDEAEEPYTAILNVARTLAAETNIDTLLKTVAEEITKVLDADRCTVFLLDKDKNELWSKVAPGLEIKEIRFSADSGIAGYSAKTGEIININDAYNDRRFNPDIDRQTGYKTKNMITMPIWNLKHEILGVFQVLNKAEGNFTEKDEETLLTIGSSVGIALENAKLFETQQKMIEGQRRLFASFIDTLAASIDARDKITAGHSSRVKMYAELISDVLELSFQEKENVLHAAILHDIGKIGIRDAVLQKDGKLTDEEYAHIQQHVKITYDILNKIYLNEEFKDVAEIASSHHEKYNGSGYFRKLKEEEIPFGGRILAVADVFDAITSKRHYRDKMPVKQALDIIKSSSGTHFDPVVVDAFFKIKTDKLVRVFLSEVDAQLDNDAAQILQKYTVDDLYKILSDEKTTENSEKLFVEIFNQYYNCKAGK